MEANTPLYKKWWFWTIAAVLALPLYLLILRAIGIATAHIEPRQDNMDYEESAFFAEMSPSPWQETVPTSTPVPTVEPTPSSPPVLRQNWFWASPPSEESIKATKTQTPTPAPKPAATPAPKPAPAVSPEYAVFITDHYQGIQSDMQTFNQLDSQMKSNKDLLYDDNWLDSLSDNITSIRTHCKKIIEYDAAQVPDGYAETQNECKAGCQLYLDGIKKYIYGVDLEDGNARVDGRDMMQEAAAILNNAVSSLQ